MLYDIFKTFSFEVFVSYKNFIMTSDLRWVNNNPTTPKAFKFITDDILKRLVADYCILAEKYSTK